MLIPSNLLFPLENESVEEASPQKLVIYSLQRFMLLNPGCCSIEALPSSLQCRQMLATLASQKLKKDSKLQNL